MLFKESKTKINHDINVIYQEMQKLHSKSELTRNTSEKPINKTLNKRKQEEKSRSCKRQE